MKPFHKYLLYLLLLTIILAAAGTGASYIMKEELTAVNTLSLTFAFSAISFTTLFIFFAGQAKEPGTQLLYTLSAISLKFLLDAVTALIWFLVAKNFQTQYVLLFFILYLAFTFFSIIVILNILNNKGL